MKVSDIVKFAIMVFVVVTARRQSCDNQFGNPCVKICENATKIHFDDSLYMLPIIKTDRKHMANRTKKTERTLTLSERTTCPKRLTEGLPLCPHYFVINYDRNRDPSIVYEARCACRGCLGSNVKRCTKVFNYRTVLYKREGSNCYERHLKAFAIACRCMGYESEEIDRSTPPA